MRTKLTSSMTESTNNHLPILQWHSPNITSSGATKRKILMNSKRFLRLLSEYLITGLTKFTLWEVTSSKYCRTITQFWGLTKTWLNTWEIHLQYRSNFGDKTLSKPDSSNTNLLTVTWECVEKRKRFSFSQKQKKICRLIKQKLIN